MAYVEKRSRILSKNDTPGFHRQHPKLTKRKPHHIVGQLIYCRAADFFGKGRIKSTMSMKKEIISITHKPGKVVAELGHRKVYARGEDSYSVNMCCREGEDSYSVNMSQLVVPPMMVYPRKKCVPEKHWHKKLGTPISSTPPFAV